MLLLSTAYFPPISYFAAIAEGMGLLPEGIVPTRVTIEACEHYQKQSYRNRCYIYTAGGVQYLQVPVVHEGGTHELPIKDIRIDYSTPWLIRSERAIDSAYESSAYFEYYRDDLFSILDAGHEHLFDLNLSLLRFFLDKTGIRADIDFTQEFIPEGSTVGITDLRQKIHPKKPDTILSDLGIDCKYFQVFADKHGFMPNLSIMDLLFNEGPDSILFLRTSNRE